MNGGEWKGCVWVGTIVGTGEALIFRGVEGMGVSGRAVYRWVR